MSADPARVAKLRTLAAQGVTMAAAAKAFGVSRQRVEQIAKREGITFAGSRTAPPEAKPPKIIPHERRAHVCACGDHGFIGLSRGAVALVSPQDVPTLDGVLWCCIVPHKRQPWRRYGGRRVSVDGRWQTRSMHRTIVGSDAPHIDHANGDGLDNRRENLRPCSAFENLRNRGRQSNSAQPYKGAPA